MIFYVVTTIGGLVGFLIGMLAGDAAIWAGAEHMRRKRLRGPLLILLVLLLAHPAKADSWSDAVDHAVAAGAKLQRECFPSTGVCQTSVVATAPNGAKLMLTLKSDQHDRPIARVVCGINSLGDIATCWPWENLNAKPTVSMRNSRGVWLDVK